MSAVWKQSPRSPRAAERRIYGLVRREAIIALAHLRRVKILPVYANAEGFRSRRAQDCSGCHQSLGQEATTNSDLLDALFNED